MGPKGEGRGGAIRWATGFAVRYGQFCPSLFLLLPRSVPLAAKPCRIGGRRAETNTLEDSTELRTETTRLYILIRWYFHFVYTT